MGKKLDKKAEPAAGKTSKGRKVDKAVKKFRKLEGKLWTREYLLKIAEFDGATIAPANGAAARADAMGTLAGEHHKLLTSEKSVELVRSLARETVSGGKIDDPQLLDEIRVLGRPARGKRHSHRGGRGLDQAHLRGRRRVAQGQDGQ